MKRPDISTSLALDEQFILLNGHQVLLQEFKNVAIWQRLQIWALATKGIIVFGAARPVKKPQGSATPDPWGN